ncbi:MAG: acyltransferase, partial [Rhizomicrobium sp.]|nr:acyltransferase [Rhizomicrobium sp.]
MWQSTVRAGDGKLDNIQVLRAIAAIMVVFVHLDMVEATLGLVPFGYGGVDLFFEISGFIMVYTTMSRSVSPTKFLANRITRIVPVYYLLTLVVFALAIAAPNLFRHTSASLMDLVRSLLFVPFRKNGGPMQPTLFVGWTLNYEMLFYVLFAVGLMFKRYRDGLLFTGAVLVVLGALSIFAPFGNDLADFYTSPRMLEFGIGMAIALVHRQIADILTRARISDLVLKAVLAAAIAMLVLIPLTPNGTKLLAMALPMALPATIALIAALVLQDRGVRIAPRTTLVGDASYSLYLTHPFAVQALQKFYVRLPPSPILALLFA